MYVRFQMPQSNFISSLFTNKRKGILLLVISTSTLVFVSRYFIRKYYRLCVPCFVGKSVKKLKFTGSESMSSSANARRPPSFEGWEVDLVKELNNTVDLRALSRDMPRLKVASPSKFSVKHEAWKLNQDQQETAETAGDEKQFYAQLEDKADRMCAALLHLEDLITTAQNEHRHAKKNRNRNAPDANDDDNNESESFSSEKSKNRNGGHEPPSVSPLRKKSLELFPNFSKDADLSHAFTSLLRNTGWLPSEAKEDETSETTGLRKGTLPCDQLLPQVRILGTMAQTVIFAPSQRMSHLLWNPTFARHLMDVDWEVFLMDHPWPENGMKKLAASSSRKNNNSKASKKSQLNEKSPLLAKNDDGDDEEEDSNNKHHKEINASSTSASGPSEQHQRPETPATQIQVRPSSTSPQVNDHDENNNNKNINNSDDDDDSTDPDPDHGEIVYVCHRIIARNVVAPDFVNRHPRFQLHWVLEIHCGKHTGVIKRTRIAGVRVRIMDDEAAVDASSSCCCGGASEWRELKGALAAQVEENFGIELEKCGDSNPF